MIQLHSLRGKEVQGMNLTPEALGESFRYKIQMSAFLYLGKFWGVSRNPIKYMEKAASQTFSLWGSETGIRVIRFSWCNGGAEFGRLF